MDTEKLFKLIDAGFTKNEIMMLFGKEEQKPAEEKKPEPKPEKVEDEKKEEKVPPTEEYTKILAAIEKLTGAVINSNINNSNIDTPAETGADDVLAKLIGNK